MFASAEKMAIFRSLVSYAERLRELVPAGHTLAQMALAFVAGRPGIHVPIPGASSPDQATMNAQVGDLNLDEDLCERICAIVAFDMPVVYY